MNLSEMNKKKDVVSIGMTQQMPISHDTIDKWKKLSQEQAETLAKVTAERDGLLKAQYRDRENIQKCLVRMRELRENLQKSSSENRKLQDELQKQIEENQKMQTELSRTQNINQLLQKNNDDLRNRNGLLSRKEQEQLEEKIRDVLNWNCKLEKLVEMSSVEAVNAAEKKQREVEQKMRNAVNQEKLMKEIVEGEVKRINNQMKKDMKKAREREQYWKYCFWVLMGAMLVGSLLEYFII